MTQSEETKKERRRLRKEIRENGLLSMAGILGLTIVQPGQPGKAWNYTPNGTPQECKFCHYHWVSRVDKPVQCPSCKRYIRYN